MYRSILVPVDATPESRKVIAPAIRLAQEQNAKLVGLHVIPAQRVNAFEGSTTYGYVSPQQYATRAKKYAEKVLDSVRKAAVRAEVEFVSVHAVSDQPHAEILNAAKRHRCDLIYMASHARRGLSRVLLGSETTKVLAHSRIPVLVHPT
ncbi:MAG TPA: universal stress protein [Burkholderiales bacterium]|nr:universal stress protein [Burkholderiales bacterium]